MWTCLLHLRRLHTLGNTALSTRMLGKVRVPPHAHNPALWVADLWAANTTSIRASQVEIDAAGQSLVASFPTVDIPLDLSGAMVTAVLLGGAECVLLGTASNISAVAIAVTINTTVSHTQADDDEAAPLPSTSTSVRRTWWQSNDTLRNASESGLFATPPLGWNGEYFPLKSLHAAATPSPVSCLLLPQRLSPACLLLPHRLFVTTLTLAARATAWDAFHCDVSERLVVAHGDGKTTFRTRFMVLEYHTLGGRTTIVQKLLTPSR